MFVVGHVFASEPENIGLCYACFMHGVCVCVCVLLVMVVQRRCRVWFVCLKDERIVRGARAWLDFGSPSLLLPPLGQPLRTCMYVCLYVCLCVCPCV